MMTNCTGCVYNQSGCKLPEGLDCPGQKFSKAIKGSDTISVSAMEVMGRKIRELPPPPPGYHYTVTDPRYEKRPDAWEVTFDIVLRPNQ